MWSSAGWDSVAPKSVSFPLLPVWLWWTLHWESKGQKDQKPLWGVELGHCPFFPWINSFCISSLIPQRWGTFCQASAQTT
jgi:hypothetical protein